MVQGNAQDSWWPATTAQSMVYFTEWRGRGDGAPVARSDKSESWTDSKTQQTFHYELIDGTEYYVNDTTRKQRKLMVV